jgi:nicotinamide-nucleotide amidase
MGVAILSIGTELTRGEIVDSNSAWLAAELTEAGFDVWTKWGVPDDVERISLALRALSERHRFIIATGGLGPTSDDLTAEAAAHAAKVELVRDESALLAVRRRIESRGRVATKQQEKQADIPAGSDILPNADGTAPGFSLQIGDCTTFFMPGVPREMRRMFSDHVLGRIRPAAPNNSFQIRLRTYGLGESAVAQRLEGLAEAHPGVTLAYRAHFPEVDVKVHGRATTQGAARELVVAAADEARSRLGDIVYGEGDEDLPLIVARALRGRGWRLAVAESCTGGLISHLLTSNAGASEYFIGSAVTYANSAKTRLLGVPEDTLRAHGAVSAEVAAAMAEGARRCCQVDVGIAVTGIAGPAGGTTKKPVGLCFWACSHPGGTTVRERVFRGDRGEVRTHVAHATLDLLRRVALGLDEEAPDDPRLSLPPAS